MRAAARDLVTGLYFGRDDVESDMADGLLRDGFLPTTALCSETDGPGAAARRSPGRKAMQWQPVLTGRSNAQVWRGLGVYRKQGDPGQIAAEAERLVWLADQGIPCPQVVEHQAGVLVTTTVPGRPAALQAAHLRTRMVDALADILHALHRIPASTCPFDQTLAVTTAHARHAVTTGAVDLDNLDPQRRGWCAADLLDLLHRTRPTDEDLVVCHGDPTVANVLFDDTGAVTGVIDVDRLGTADRYRDLAITTRSLSGKWAPRYGDRLMHRYGMDPSDVKISFYRLLDEFY